LKLKEKAFRGKKSPVEILVNFALPQQPEQFGGKIAGVSIRERPGNQIDEVCSPRDQRQLSLSKIRGRGTANWSGSHS